MKLRLLCSILLLFSFGKVFAQNYPVQVTPQFLPPSPIYLSSYADGTTINSPLRVQLLLNDITLSNREVRLKIYIEGTGINLQGSDLVIGSESIYLDGGVPLTLTNELAPYFELKNMQGINPANYANPLSEGSYQFCFEVYDAFTGNKLSNKTCASTLIFQNDPPFLNMPFKDEEIPVNNPQNIVFQWTPRHINVSNVEYELSIVEIWDHYVDPQAAFFSMPPIFQVTTRNTSYLMGPSDPPLLPNKKYAWRVKAKALQGAEEIGLFKNHGYSEIYWFNHTQPCEAPPGLYAELKGASKVNIFWEPNPEAYKSYTIAYREAGNTESDWYFKTTNSDWVTIWDLKPGTTYEYMVKGICELGESEYSESQTITTELLDNSDSFYSCGLVPDEIAISNREPLPTLLPGDEIYAGDFVVTVTDVSGSNGIYSGRGYVKIPYLNLITLGVTFNGILVNTAHQLAEGEIVTLYDPAFGEGAEMTVNVSLELGNASTLDYEDIYVDGEIQSVVVNSEGNIVVQTTSGPVTINTQGESSSGGDLAVEPGTPVKIKDDAGNEYTVVDGVVTQGGGESITNENSNELTGAGKALVTFENAPQSKYGLDVYKKEYESTKLKRFYPEVEAGEKNYFVSWKALASGKMEPLLAKIEVKDNGLDLNKISFETNTGTKYTSQGGTDAKERTVQLAGKGNMQEEELYAFYPTDSTALTLGRINTVSYDEVRHKVVVVSLGSSKYPGSATELQNGLNTIYSQAAVSWEVEVLQAPLNVTYKSPLIVGEKGNNYIRSLKEIINAYKRTKLVHKNTYYLFLADKLQNESGKDVEGYMLRGGQYGFIAVNSQNIIKTIAHELGHGAFHLKHAFSKYNTSETSDNLMDYSNGITLVKDQWDDIHNPALIIGLLESNEDGEQATVSNMELLKPFQNEDGSFTFISLAGKPISLPAKTSSVTFSTGDDLNLQNCINEFKIEPFGSLKGFVIDKIEYTYCASCNSSNFAGYFEKGKGCDSASKYIDTLSNEKNKNAIVGLPCVKDDAVIFKAMLSSNYFKDFNFSTITPDYNGNGELKPYDYILSEYNNITDNEIIYLPANFNPKFDQDVIDFLSSEFCNCNENDFVSIAYGFVYATQLQKNKEYLGCFKTGVPLFFYDENVNETKFHYAVVKEWEEKNINGFNTLKNNIEKFKKLKSTFSKSSDSYALHNFLKYYVPEHISQSNVNSYKLRFGTTYWESGVVLDKIQNITDNQLERQFDDVFCLWESISLEDRIYALNHISTNNRANDRSEEILLYLIISEKNIPSILDELKKNNYQLFWSIWGQLDAEQRGILISYLNTQLINDTTKNAGEIAYQNYIKNCENAIGADCDLNAYKILPIWRANALNVVDFAFDLGPGGLTYEFDYSLETSESKGNVNIKASTNYIDFSRLEDYWGYFITNGTSLFDSDIEPFMPILLVVREDIKLNGNIILKKDQLATVPALFLHWLDSTIDSEQNQVIIRVAADGLILATIIGTGGATTPLLALDLVVFGTDFVFQIVNETSDSIDPEIEEVWNSIYNLYSIANIPRAVVATVSAGKSFISFVKNSSTAARWNKMVINPQYIDDYVNQFKNLPEAERAAKIASEITLLDNIILALKDTPRLSSTAYIPGSLYRNLITARLKLANVQFNVTGISMGVEASATSFSPYLKVLNSSGNSTAIANVTSSSNNTSKLSLELVRWLPANIVAQNIKTVGKIENITYLSPNGISETGSLDIVEDISKTGQFYLKVEQSFLHILQSEYPNIYSKTNALSQTLKNQFLSDFKHLDANALSKLNANNAELVDVWKKWGNPNSDLVKLSNNRIYDISDLEAFNKVYKNTERLISFDDFYNKSISQIKEVIDLKKEGYKKFAVELFEAWNNGYKDGKSIAQMQSVYVKYGLDPAKTYPPCEGIWGLIEAPRAPRIGEVFDRFQTRESLGGGYAGYLDDINSVPTISSRALKENYSEIYKNGDDYYYFLFEIKNIPSGLIFEFGEAMSWFGELGGSIQIKSSISLQNLNNSINIKEKWVLIEGKWINTVEGVVNSIEEYLSLPLTKKLVNISNAWTASYPQIFFERQLFEDIMGYYKYSKSSGWGHTADIANNFKALDFYYDFTVVGDRIFAKTAVSMKTTTTKSVDDWLNTNAVKSNIDNLKSAVGSAADKGITWNGKTIFYNKAEIHIYMPKENLTQALKTEWLNKLSTEHPTIKFEINSLEDFVK